MNRKSFRNDGRPMAGALVNKTIKEITKYLPVRETRGPGSGSYTLACFSEYPVADAFPEDVAVDAVC